jgi:hypothetical protein
MRSHLPLLPQPTGTLVPAQGERRIIVPADRSLEVVNLEQQLAWTRLLDLTPSRYGRIPHVEITTCFVENNRGAPLYVNFREAAKIVVELNKGRSYGNNCEGALTRAIYNETYTLGDVFIPSLQYLTGKDILGNFVCRKNLRNLLQFDSHKFPEINRVLKKPDLPYCGLWAVTNSEACDQSSSVHQARLAPNGNGGISERNRNRAFLLLCRVEYGPPLHLQQQSKSRLQYSKPQI